MDKTKGAKPLPLLPEAPVDVRPHGSPVDRYREPTLMDFLATLPAKGGDR